MSQSPVSRSTFYALLFAGGALLSAAAGGAGYLVVHSDGVNGLGQMKAPARYTWRSLDKKHWQAANESNGTPPVLERGARGRCAEGMVEVDGYHLLDPFSLDTTGYVEELQNRACTNWISKEFPARCQTFDRPQWLELAAGLPRRQLTFCIDEFEFPNKQGENPIIVVDYYEAGAMCRAQGKRLCNESEWTMACEGEEGKPYPYGYDRNPSACVVDRQWRQFKEGALWPRDTDVAREEVDRLWQGAPSGTHPLCRSPYGVFDMTGNVDEWTQTVRSGGFSSILKGGYWGPVRARCRPSTRAHNERFLDYQEGFRCCGDVSGVAASGSVVTQSKVRVDLGLRAAAEHGARGRSIDDVPKAIEDRDELKALAAQIDTAQPTEVGVGQACSLRSREESNAPWGALSGIAAMLAVRVRRGSGASSSSARASRTAGRRRES